MLFGVQLGGFVVMLGGVQVMPVRHAGMMRSLFVLAGFMVLRGFAVMFGRMLVVMRSLFVMLVNLVLVQVLAVHRRLPGCFDAAASIASFDEPIATGVCQFTPLCRVAEKSPQAPGARALRRPPNR